MKKKHFLVILLFVAAPLSAQTYDQMGWIAKFGMAVGFTPTVVFPDFSSINVKMENLGLDAFPESGIITYGGGGYAYLTFIKNLRIGGTGFSGSSSRSTQLDGKNISVEYSTGGGALTLEYTIPTIKNMALSVGVMLGGGSSEIDIYSSTGELSWDDIWSNQSSTAEANHKNISNSFYFVSPTVNLDFPLNRFAAIRIGGGYQFTVFNDWEYNNDLPLSGVPENSNSDMWFIQTGIFVGFFAF